MLPSSRKVRILFTAFMLFVLAIGSACAPPTSSPDGKSTTPDGSPELTEETIRARLNETRVWDIPEENGASDPISWRFFEDEPKEVAVVEKKVEGTRATVTLEIKTMSSPRARDPRYLAGQIRTQWELRTGWVLRRWEIVSTENLSMKYRNLPKPSPTLSPGK